MSVAYLLYRAPQTQSWGGYLYEKGTPRGVGLHLNRNGVDFLFSKTFGAGADVYVGTEATERLTSPYYERFGSETTLMAAIPPALSVNVWLFDDEQMTPDVLIARGSRVLAGKPARLTDDEAYALPAAVAERARRAAQNAKLQKEIDAWWAVNRCAMGRLNRSVR